MEPKVYIQGDKTIGEHLRGGLDGTKEKTNGAENAP